MEHSCFKQFLFGHVKTMNVLLMNPLVKGSLYCANHAIPIYFICLQSIDIHAV